MKNTLFTAVITLFAANLCANQTAQPESKMDARVEDNATAQNEQMMMGNNCDSLPADQKSFALQLNASNRTTFCNQFTPSQRASAMQMSGTMNNGVRMTPDMAVEQTARGMTPGKNPGGCPVSR